MVGGGLLLQPVGVSEGGGGWGGFRGSAAY